MFGFLAGLLRNSATVARSGAVTSSSDADFGEEYFKRMGNELFVQQKIEDALVCYWKALSINPDYSDAQWNVALASLFSGDYVTGFKYFEKRFVAGDKAHSAHLQNVMRMMSGKRHWQGEELHGERLLVWTEQGHGDALMFLRYLPQLRQKGPSRLLVACETELVRIMRLPDVDEVISKDLLLPADHFDAHCSLLSLPHLLGTTLDTLPRAVPYLSVPSETKDKWVERLARLGGLRVGLTWAGGKQLAQDALRSVVLERFAHLTKIEGITLVSLQKGEPAGQLADLGWPIIDWMDECADFLDTAALVDSLDLVISVDTAVAHLAGALGKPVWLLNRFESEWRWMLGREDSPWYPTMRIFRQPAVHDWDSVIGRIAAELESVTGQINV